MDNIAKSLVLQAIQEGIALAPHVYAERLEQRLAFDVSLQEADGDVSAVLEEQMIDELLPYCEINESNGEIQFDDEMYLSEAGELMGPHNLAKAVGNLPAGSKVSFASGVFPGGSKQLSPQELADAYRSGLQTVKNTEITRNAQQMAAGYKSGLDSAAQIDRFNAYNKAIADQDKADFGLKTQLNDKFDIYKHKIGSAINKAGQFVNDNRGAVALGAAGAAALAGGAYLLYRHLNSPKKVQSAIEKTNAKLSQARKENDTKAVQKYDKKLKVLNMKMDALRKKGKA